MINGTITAILFLTSMLFFGALTLAQYCIGHIEQDAGVLLNAIFSLISFYVVTIMTLAFYGEESLKDMNKAISFSSSSDVISFVLLLLVFVVNVVFYIARKKVY